MKPTRVLIPVEGLDPVSGMLHAAAPEVPGTATAVILAHGAGNDMDHPLLITVSEQLAGAGVTALRFNFPYKEKGRKAPDAQGTLVRTWRAVEAFVREGAGIEVDRLVCGGKSMGGRVASQMAAEWVLPAEGLVFLGYPLHPPGKKERLRDAHLYGLHQPMLFFAGTRDPLCDLDLLRQVLGRIQAPWTLETVEGGDHSFETPKSSGVSKEVVYDRIARKTVAWVQALS